jgi:hypothetical protein
MIARAKRKVFKILVGESGSGFFARSKKKKELGKSKKLLHSFPQFILLGGARY